MEPTTSGASPTTTQATTIGDASAALAMADSSLAAPTTEGTPAPETAPAAATSQPQDQPQTTESVSTDPPKGEPPKWRWQDILANAREASAKEAEARVRQEIESRYQWTQGIAEQERSDLLALHRALSGDANARQYVARVNPTFAAAAGWIDAPAHPAADPEPQPDFVLPVRDAQGNLVGERPMYSAEQQTKREAWLERQLMAKVQQQLAPLQQTAQTFQQREQLAAYTTSVTSALAQMKAADPQFEKHMPDVAAVIQHDPRLSDLAMTDPATAVEVAYARVYRAKVQPAQQSQTEAQVLAKLQQQAVAGTTNPSAATPGTPTQTLGDARAALAHAASLLGG